MAVVLALSRSLTPTTMSSRTSTKRSRTGDSDEDFIPLNRRFMDPALWFDDGSVVFATDTRLFRVHKGVLAKVSGIFADLFSVPQPAEGGDEYEGVPLVYLPGDDGEDVLHFLKCIYERS